MNLGTYKLRVHNLRLLIKITELREPRKDFTSRLALTSLTTGRTKYRKIYNYYKMTSHTQMAFLQPSSFKLRTITSKHFMNQQGNCSIQMQINRRTCLQYIAQSAIALSFLKPSTSNAAMYSADTKADEYTSKGDPKKLETYLPQIEAGYQALVDLENNWEAKTKDFDGDVVRRVLGTVGVKSPLFNIRKTFFKSWEIIANTSTDDALIERLETEWNDVINGISSVDFQMYSVNFTELTETKENLVRQGKQALDDTITIYTDLLKDFHSVR